MAEITIDFLMAVLSLAGRNEIKQSNILNLKINLQKKLILKKPGLVCHHTFLNTIVFRTG
jgi:hypothetical protein